MPAIADACIASHSKNHPILIKILYTAADFELDERHVALVLNKKKLHWTDSEFHRIYFLLLLLLLLLRTNVIATL